jgi:copper chaperone CopZ
MPASGVMECPLCYVKTPHRHRLAEKIKGMIKYAFGDFLDDISLHLIIGIIISGLISYFLPEDFFSRYAGNTLVEMLIMIAGGIPLYVCATASIPIAMAMMMKGLSPGAAFVFLAVGPATNAAAVILIARTMGKRFVTVFLVSISVFSILAGYALNYTFEKTGAQISHAHMMHEHAGHSFNWWAMFFSLIFLVMLVLSLYRKYGVRLGYRMLVFLKAGKPGTGIRCVLSVEGMTCKNCALKVSNALYAVGGVRKVEVDLKTKQVKVTGHGKNGEMKEAVRKAGYIVLDE